MLRFSATLAIAFAVVAPVLAAEPFVPIDPTTNAPYRGNFAPVDHLEPEITNFSGPGISIIFDDEIIDLLADLYADGVKVRMVAFPTFDPVYAVGIEESNGTFRIVTLKLRATSSMQLGNRPLRDINVDRCDAQVATPVAEHLVNTWREMLLRTRYATSETAANDGTEFHFASVPGLDRARRVFHDMIGQTWEPDPNSSPGLLVGISNTMWKYCETRNPALADQLDRQAIALLTRLGVPH